LFGGFVKGEENYKCFLLAALLIFSFFTFNTTTFASNSISTNELMSKIWSFGRIDGTILAGAMKLGANGKILDGTGHWNETSWKFENGILYFYGADGSSITTKFNSFKETNGKLVISGPYSYDASITHVLNEVGSFDQSTTTSTSGSGIKLKATPGDGKVYLEWTDNSYSYATAGYNLFRGTNSGSETSTPVTDFIITGNSYTDPNVENGTYYCYIAKPVYTNGSMGSASNEACATPTGYSGGATSGGSSGNIGGNNIILQINNPYITVNGSRKEIDPGRGTVPILYNGRTLLPIRSIVESIGGTISWADYEEKVTIQCRGKVIELWIGNNTARVNGINSYTDVAPQLTNDRTMLPLRFITENLGAEVDWNSDTFTVTMNFK
jgi:hypothetical protein